MSRENSAEGRSWRVSRPRDAFWTPPEGNELLSALAEDLRAGHDQIGVCRRSYPRTTVASCGDGETRGRAFIVVLAGTRMLACTWTLVVTYMLVVIRTEPAVPLAWLWALGIGHEAEQGVCPVSL